MGRPCVIPLVADSATAAPFSQPTSALAGAPGSGSAEAVAGGVPRVASDTCDDQEELGPMLHRASSGSSLSSMDGSFTGSLVSQSGMCCHSSFAHNAAHAFLCSCGGHSQLRRQTRQYLMCTQSLVCRCELLREFGWQCHESAQQQRDLAAALHAV